MGELARLLNLGPRELMAIVGGGGKTTLAFGLAAELAGEGHRVVVATTTRMGRDELERAPVVVWTARTSEVDAALSEVGPVLVAGSADDHKVLGVDRSVVDRLYHESTAEYVIVEADGARRQPFKAPQGHEPVIPEETTLLVIVVGIDAIGLPVFEGAHRPERVMALTGAASTEPITPPIVATVLGHPDGGLKGAPLSARVLVAVTKATSSTDLDNARAVQELLDAHDRITDVVLVPPIPSN